LAHLFIAVFFISLSILAFEVLLTRIFAYTSWHHFGYMIISLALLGFGASGSFLALTQRWVKKRAKYFFLASSFACALSLFLATWLSQKIPFEAMRIVWYPGEFLLLLGQYVVLTLPFFFGALCIGISFMMAPRRINLIYAANLVGSGAGALFAVGIMHFLFPLDILRSLSLLALFGALVFAFSLGKEIFGAALVAALIMGVLFLGEEIEFKPSEYKWLSYLRDFPESEVLESRFSPLGQIDVVQSPAIRRKPGLSLAYTEKYPAPQQLALIQDGDSFSAITEFHGDWRGLEFLDYFTSSLAYHLLERPETIVLGAGGGLDVLSALYHRPRAVEAVEIDSEVIDLVNERFGEFSGRLYSGLEVKVNVAEARSFMEKSQRKYDLIQISLMDSFGAASAGVYSLAESFLYTREAFETYLWHLNPGGILSITRWYKQPIRDSIKLFATAVEALEASGVQVPGRHLLLIRGMKTATLLIKASPFTSQDIEKAKIFCASRSFDLCYYFGMPPAEANIYHKLPEPLLYNAAIKILSPEREDFYRRYAFYIRPATDDRPYFFHFFKWRVLPQLADLGRAGMTLADWGYLILVGTLLQAALVSGVLIILPLFFLPKGKAVAGTKWRTLFYFLSIGLGFMFIEMAYIQKFIIFLGHPTYAIAVVVAGFLIFSGLGSFISSRLERKRPGAVLVAVVAIVAIALCEWWLLKIVFHSFLGQSGIVKIVISLAAISPLAFFMGMPFPANLSRLSATEPGLVPWAWGINGFASVLAAVLAIMLAISLGFRGVVVLAVVFYAVAAASALRRGFP